MKFESFKNILEEYVEESKLQLFKAELDDMIKELEDESFMNGYQYAITVLKEQMVKKND